MNKTPVERECECGNTITVDSHRHWCKKCGKAVYHDPKDQKRHKRSAIYFFLLFIGSITFMVYIYLTLIDRYAFN